jgi:hypothetical protein
MTIDKPDQNYQYYLPDLPDPPALLTYLAYIIKLTNLLPDLPDLEPGPIPYVLQISGYLFFIKKPWVLFAGGGDLSTTSHRGHVVDSGQYGKGNFYSHCFKIIEIKW